MENRTMRYRLSIPLIALSLAAIGSPGCNQLDPADEPNGSAEAIPAPPPKAAEIAEPEPEAQGGKSVVLPGASVRGFETTQLMAKTGGYVKTIGNIDGEEVDIGTFVAEGTVLATLDVPEIKNQLDENEALVRQARRGVELVEAVIKQRKAGIDQRKAEVKQAEAQLKEKGALLTLQIAKRDRILDLIDKGRIGSENREEVVFAVSAADAAIAAVNADIETANANEKAADADLEKAEADKLSAEEHVNVALAARDQVQTLIDYARIKAPFDGVITRRLVDRGAFVRSATSNSGAMPLFEITRIDKVRVTAWVPNSQVANVQVGQRATFDSIGGLPGARIKGSVTRIARTLDPDSRMMRIEVHFSNPIEDAVTHSPVHLQPGMFGSLTVGGKQED
jgi:multidrug resistance efflux pump